MAAPSVRSVGTFASGTTTCTPGLPSGWAENDIFVLLAECDDAETPNNPSGYSFLGSGTSGTDVKLSVWVKRATASESAPTVNGTTNHVHAVIAAVQGADTAGSPWLLGSFTDNDGVGSGGVFAGLTTTVADALVLMLSAIGDNANDAENLSAYANGNLTSITEHQDQAETTGTGGGTGIASGVKAVAEATGDSTATHDNAVAWATVHLAIYPAAASIVTLDASIAGVGAVVADFVRTQTFAVSIAGLGTVAADLVLAPVTFEASIAGTGTVTPDLVLAPVVFEVGVSGTGSVVTQFELTKLFDVSIEGTSAVVADFVRQVGLGVILLGQGTVGAELVNQLSFETAIAGLATVVPDQLAVQVGMEAIVSGVGQVLADFVRTPLAIEAAIAGNGVLAVDIQVTSGAGEELTIRTIVGVGL